MVFINTTLKPKPGRGRGRAELSAPMAGMARSQENEVPQNQMVSREAENGFQTVSFDT